MAAVLPRPVLDRWPWFALFASALMLGAAHYAQRVDGLPPCILCLKQREAYWAAIGIAGAGILSVYTPWRDMLYRVMCWLLAAAFLYGMGMAIYHVGAEMKWWDGPKACAAGAAASAQDIADLLAGKSKPAVSCEDPTYWPIKGGLTMAGWNVIVSAVLAVLSAAAALKGRRA